MTEEYIVLAVAGVIYLAGLAHHTMALISEKRTKTLTERNERANADFCEASALVQYGAFQEATDVLKPYLDEYARKRGEVKAE